MPPSHNTACLRLRGQNMLFAGDSLIRDVWTAAALWLLNAPELHQAPISQSISVSTAWRILEPLGIVHRLRSGGLVEGAHPQTSLMLFHVCNHSTRLYYMRTTSLKQAESIVQKARALNTTRLIVSHGLEEMSRISNPQWNLQKWAHVLPVGSIYLGIHHRIENMAPHAHWRVAHSSQGNTAIRLWTRLMIKHSHHHMCVVDPYTVTLGQGNSTVDGIHFGYFPNVQKFWLLLESACFDNAVYVH